MNRARSIASIVCCLIALALFALGLMVTPAVFLAVAMSLQLENICEHFK